MNATSLYIETCRYVIQANPYDPETWSDLYRYLPYLRQSMACCVCSQVLHIPMGPTGSICQHHVCKECVGGKLRLKPACSWCKDYELFTENPSLRILVQCFKKLCEYLASSAIAINLGNASNGETNSLMTIIQEGMAVKDCYSHISSNKLCVLPPKLQKVCTPRHSREDRNEQPERRDSSSHKPGKGEGHDRGSNHCPKSPISAEAHTSKRCSNKQILLNGTEDTDLKVSSNSECTASDGNKSLYETVASEHDYIKELTPQERDSQLVKHYFKLKEIPKIRIRKIESDHESLVKKPKLEPEESETCSSSPGNCDENNSGGKNRNSSSKKKGQGCRCGMATPNPGKLTCCGQRCPCYSAFMGCVGCRCRGCRNPRGDPPGAATRSSLLLQGGLRTQGQTQHIWQIQPVTSTKNADTAEDTDVDIDV